MAKKIKLLALLCAFLLITTQVFAHERKYVWTEIYQTLPKNGREIELWTTLKVPNGNRTNVNTLQYQGELEYGATNHLTLAAYQRWETANRHGVDDNGIPKKDSTNYQGFKFEGKYRIGEKGKYWVDPLLYLEWSTEPREHPNENEIEGKIVLSKDFDKFNFSYNQIMESKLGRGGRTEHNYAVGAGYETFEELRLGGEMTGNYWHPSDHKNEMALGPTVAYSGKYFWMTIGAAFAVNKHTDDVQARVIVGIPF